MTMICWTYLDTAVKFDVTRNGRAEQRDDIVCTKYISTPDEMEVGAVAEEIIMSEDTTDTRRALQESMDLRDQGAS